MKTVSVFIFIFDHIFIIHPFNKKTGDRSGTGTRIKGGSAKIETAKLAIHKSLYLYSIVGRLFFITTNKSVHNHMLSAVVYSTYVKLVLIGSVCK